MAKCYVLTFIGIALDGYVELNAARTSIQRVVLFSNSREVTIQVCVRCRNGPKLPFFTDSAFYPRKVHG